jgi:hypothetical protein
MCGLMRLILLSRGECPAGRADYASRGHFVACVPDGWGWLVGPRVARRVFPPEAHFGLDDVFVEALYRYKCERWRCPAVILQRSLGLEY